MSNTESLLRQWAMLKAIPRHPYQISVEDLLGRLHETGFKVSKRTVQRDLQALSGPFTLISQEKSRPYGWSFMRDAPALNIPGMDPTTAVTLCLIEQFIQPLLPPNVHEQLAPYFSQARQVLEELSDTGLGGWAERVAFIGRGPSMLAPRIPPDVADTVYEALLHQTRFRAHYRPRKDDLDATPREYVVNPLGLVIREQVIYLVCTLWDYADVRQLALHRIQDAEPLDEPVTAPAGFSLEAYLKAGYFDYPQGGEIQLEACFDPSIARHLHESPLSDEQTIETLADGRVRVRATVLDSAQLRWWLLSFGEYVEVLAPAALRERMRQTAQRLAASYAD